MAAVRKKLFTASDLATMCEVDLKTIHNWVDRGRITHFRTPGRHLRFRAADVVEFLRTWGYDVPRELKAETTRVVMVVGPPEIVTLAGKVLGISAAEAIPPPSPSGIGLAPTGGRRSPSEPPGPAEVEPKPAPLRHVAHPYDALIQVGADPAEVFLVDLAALAPDRIEPAAFFEALRRACPQGIFVALSDTPVSSLPPFVHCIGRDDAHSLDAILHSTSKSEPPPAEHPLDLAASG
ncbi:MAG: helix-turn-helix domain-containing protein [Byssovorax sp.]